MDSSKAMFVNLDSLVRKLNERETELYSQSVSMALDCVPAFRDGVALLRPFFDGSCSTAYTDEHARVGLGPWFFEQNVRMRGAIVLHEVMHVLNNHFARARTNGYKMELMNIGGDFEINSSLSRVRKIDLGSAIMPDKKPFNYPLDLTMEQYIYLLNEDMNDEEKKAELEKLLGEMSDSVGEPQSGAGIPMDGEGSSSGESEGDGSESNGSSSNSKNNGNKDGETPYTCAVPTSQRSEAADNAGIEQASKAEQTVMKQNARARIVEELKKSKNFGSDYMHDFLQVALDRLEPPKVSWVTLFRSALSRSFENVVRGRVDYSYKRSNRRFANSEYVFPGVVQYTPTAIIGLDTSGSMSSKDYANAFAEINSILKTLSKNKNGVGVFCVTTQVEKIELVRSYDQVNLAGGGGTDMSVAFKFINSLPKRKSPDVFVLATDGFTDWSRVERELSESHGSYKSIILITSEDSFHAIPNSVKKLATVIDISASIKKK